MKENITFRSSFNGFNREDVVAYIANLMNKIAEAEDQSKKMEEQAREKENELQAEREKWEIERAELTSRCEELQEKCASLKEDFASQEERCASWDRERIEKNTKIEYLERQLNESRKISQDNEIKLGSAMLEAKRFSEMLVKEAQDKAESIYRSASDCVDDSTVSAEKLRDRMIALNEEFSGAMGSILTHMNGMIDDMKAFESEANERGSKFRAQPETNSGEAEEP